MESIGKYSIQGILSQDDTGVLYHAVDTVLDRDVSIKVIHKHFVESEEARDRFFEDARAAMQLTHENIAPLHDVSEHDGQLYLVMEYLDGYDLTTVRDAGIRIPLIEKLRFAHQMARGLKYAHSHGIVHGQLRPEAIVIVKNGELKIRDFVGAPKKAGHETSKAAAGTLVDMLEYLSPEHVQETELDARSDIFSFGSILYELIQGDPPFRASRKSDIIENILHRAPPDMDRDPGAGSTEAEQIIFNCLAKDPDDRYPSCDDLLRHLEALIQALEAGGSALGSDRLTNILAETADPDRDVNAVSHVVLTSSGDFETRTVAFEVPRGSGKEKADSSGEREDRLGYRMMMSPAALARPRKQRKRRIVIGAVAAVVPVLALIVWFFVLPDDPVSDSSGAAAARVQSASTTATVASDVNISLSEPRDTLIAPASGARFSGETAPTLSIIDPPALGVATVERDSLIRYTPEEDVSGDDEFNYALTWPSGRVEQGQVRVTIPSASNTAPAFTSQPDETSIDVGRFFSYDIVADDPDGDGLTISSLSAVPSWMRFVDRGNGSASLRGTPSAENTGRYPITLEVSDGSAAAEQRFTVVVESSRTPPAPATPAPSPAARTVGAPSSSSPSDGATGLDTTVPLSWSSVSGADLYRAQVSLNPAFSAIVADGSTSSTSWTATGLAGNTQYYWRVRASQARNPGAWSTVRSFTTRVAGEALVQRRIDQYISQLDTAFDQRDADALEEVHPDYDDWYFQLFSASTQFDASFDATDVEVDGSLATARVTITVTYEGGEDVDTRIWTLEQQGGSWQLQSMEKL